MCQPMVDMGGHAAPGAPTVHREHQLWSLPVPPSLPLQTSTARRRHNSEGLSSSHTVECVECVCVCVCAQIQVREDSAMPDLNTSSQLSETELAALDRIGRQVSSLAAPARPSAGPSAQTTHGLRVH